MPAIPLPFVTAIMLLLMLLTLIKRGPALRPAACFILACLLMVLLVGLRWSYAFPAVRYLQPLAASLLPVVAWRCFSVITDSAPRRGALMLALAPAVAALLMALPVRFFPVDSYIALLSLGGGVALIRRARAGPDAFTLSRLGETGGILRAVLVAGAALCFSGMVDLLIALDFMLFAGHHAPTVVALGQLLLMAVLAAAIVTASRTRPEASPSAGESAVCPASVEEDQEICRRIAQLLAGQQLYCDPDLTLDRLARKAVIPARKISRAVNRVQGCNVSQWVNRYRVEKAQALLLTTPLSVTEIMLASGFRTKSNFNREFLRISGVSPGDYRKMGASPST